MDDVNFLEEAATADSTATLMVLLPDGAVVHIPKVSPFAILDKCPLLFHAFESGAHSIRQASIEATSRSAVISLLRYLYNGIYLADPEQPSGSLLMHAEAFKIAEDFHVPEFQVQAYVNFTRETEFACYVASPPSDLCTVIEFLYKHLASQQSREQQSLLDTLLNYCLSNFKYQGLGHRKDFRQVVFDNPVFHQDLCKTSMLRNFEDEGATDIMQMPVCRPTPSSQQALNKRIFDDFQLELWQDSEDAVPEDDDMESNSGHAKRRKSFHHSFTLVHRPNNADEVATFSEGDSDSESSSDEQGFTLVHRPKPQPEAELTSAPLLSSGDAPSPLVVPLSPSAAREESQDESAALLSNDEWSLV